MELIKKSIDLEQYKSRLPANVPPCRDDLYCQFKNEIDGDWGMVPKTVRVPDYLADLISDETETILNIPVEGQDGVYYASEPFSKQFVDHCVYMHNTFPENPKWNKYYYVQNEKLYEVNQITNITKEAKYLSFTRLHKWFKFFFFYNEAFLGGYGYKEFKSAVERWNWEKTTMHLYDFKYKTEECVEYDRLFNARGGSEVMKWMFEQVFGCFRVVLDDWKDYYDLVPHFLFFGQVRQWKAWFDSRVDKYADMEWLECKETEDCCDCSEWFRKGAMDMYNWLHKQVYPEFDESLCIDGSINLTVFLNQNISDLGFYVPVISDFSSNQSYNVGNEVVYDEHVYRLTSTDHNYHGNANGIDYSPEYKEKMFGDLNPDKFNDDDFVYEWKPEDEWDWNRFEGEMMEVNNGHMLTGVTTSKLYDLRDLIVSTDDLGNELKGYMVQSDKSQEDSTGNTVFVQPDEGSELDMIYHIGNVDDLTTETSDIKDPDTDGVFHTLYWGSIITEMKFYLKNKSGEIIPVIEGNEDSFKGTNDTNLDAIHACLKEMDIANGLVSADESLLNFEGLSDRTVMSTIYCDIEYVIGGMVDKVYGTTTEGDFYFYQELAEDASYNPYKYKVGVRYKETCKIEKGTEFYHTNEGTSILLYYYEPKFSKTTVSVEGQYDVLEQSANFTAYTYCNADNDYNGVVTLRMIRRDTDLNLSSPYTETSDIYVQRGQKSAIDKNLKLQEVRSFEALEQYGNGSIAISDSE